MTTDLLAGLDCSLQEIRQGLQVGVVDDEQEFRDELNDTLERESFSVSVPIDISEPLNLSPVLERCIESDALILDLDLGYDLDGTALARKVQEIQPEKWIIVVTGHMRRLDEVRQKLPFVFQASFPKSDVGGEKFFSELDALAKRKLIRDVAHSRTVDALHTAAQAQGTVDQQLAFAEAKDIFRRHILPVARDRHRDTRLRSDTPRPAKRFEIVLMIAAGLDRLSFVQGEDLAVPTSDQLEEVAACVQILRRSPLTFVDETEVYDRLRFVGLGIGAQAGDLPQPGELRGHIEESDA